MGRASSSSLTLKVFILTLLGNLATNSLRLLPSNFLKGVDYWSLKASIISLMRRKIAPVCEYFVVDLALTGFAATYNFLIPCSMKNTDLIRSILTLNYSCT